jgi:hypothetical protein
VLKCELPGPRSFKAFPAGPFSPIGARWPISVLSFRVIGDLGCVSSPDRR